MSVRGFPATFYVFPNISEYGVSSWDFCFELVDHCHIISIPGAPFGEQGEGHLRFSYATSRQTIVEAMERIKKYVAPVHAKRRGWYLPCARTGKCVDCKTEKRICNKMMIVEYEREKDRITVILVGEDLGI